MLQFWDHQHLCQFLCSLSLHVISLMFQICWIWKWSVCQGRFHKLRIWKNFMWYGETRYGYVCLWCSVFRGVLHLLIVWIICLWVFLHACLFWNLYLVFFLNSRDVVIQGFHIRLKVVEVIFRYGRWLRRDIRDNSYWLFVCFGDVACVAIGSHCEEYILVEIVVWFLDNKLLG